MGGGGGGGGGLLLCTCIRELFSGLRPKLNKVSQALLETVKPLNMVDQAAGRSDGAERGTWRSAVVRIQV